TDAATHLVVPNVPVTFTDTASWNTGNITKGDGTTIADGAVACTTDAAGTCDVTLKTLKVRSTTATSGDNIAYDVKLVAGTNPAPVTVPSLFLAGAPDASHTRVGPAAGTEEYMLAQHADQVVVVDATLKDVNGNPVPVWTAAPELRQPNGLGVTITAESGTGLTNAITWKLNAGNLHAPWVTDANTKYEVWAKNSSGALADVMTLPGELPVMPKFTALIAPEAHFITDAARSGASLADTALGLVPEKGLTDGDIPLSKFVTIDPVPSILGEYPVGARPVHRGYKMHSWTDNTYHVIPDTVRVCADIKGTAGPQRCGGQFTPADAPNTVRDLTTEAQVTVDIPKLTVYVAPLYGRASGTFDAASRGTDGSIAVYHSVCKSLDGGAASPEIIEENGTVHTYTYTRTTTDMAPTRLAGSQSVPSDYNYEPGQRFVQKNWPSSGQALQTPATLGNNLVCSDRPDGWADGGWCGSVNLAPVVVGNSDINYIAGWRYNTTDHSVAMLNMKQGTGAAAPMVQPNGQNWAAGGVACVLERQ
ncbi:TPA: hypothetical protein OGI49_004949, partial [Salmonella enterica]|nr:hypothetical protein [Salmonella enterica]